MGITALVTGSADRVGPVVDALRAAGASVVGVSDLDRLDAELTAFPAGTLNCYVQLPVTLRPGGATVVSRVSDFLESGLIRRFHLVQAVLPVLSDDGRVVLVAGHTPVDRSAPDDRAARIAFLTVLADAIRADRPPAKARVLVLDHRQPAHEIARLALTAESARRPSAERRIAEREPELSYQDWRTEILGQATVEV